MTPSSVLEEAMKELEKVWVNCFETGGDWRYKYQLKLVKSFLRSLALRLQAEERRKTLGEVEKEVIRKDDDAGFGKSKQGMLGAIIHNELRKEQRVKLSALKEKIS